MKSAFVDAACIQQARGALSDARRLAALFHTAEGAAGELRVGYVHSLYWLLMWWKP